MKKLFKINLLVLMLFTLISVQNVQAASDPYSNYKDIKWAGTSTIDGIKISNGKLECNDKYKLVCDLTSSIDAPIKKVSTFGSYNESVSLLTESGKVYVYDYNYELHDMEFKQILNDYKIIDMTEEMRDYSLAYYYNVSFDTEWHNSSGFSPFYLTSDGKLMNLYSKTYEEVNQDFIYSKCFVDVAMGFRSYKICLYFSQDNSVSYKESKRKENDDYVFGIYDYNANYIKFKNKDNNILKAKYIYDITYDEKRDKTLIVDENNDLYEVIFGNDKEKTKLQYIGRIVNSYYVNFEFNDDEIKQIVFKFSNGSEYGYETLNDTYFDVGTHTANSLEKVNELYKNEVIDNKEDENKKDVIDNKDESNPETGDTILMYVGASIILVLTIIFSIKKLKKINL